MDNLVARVPLQDLRIIVTAILIQRRAAAIWPKCWTRRRISFVNASASAAGPDAYRTGPADGWILTFLPVVLGIALYLVNPDNMSLLWTP